MLEDKESEYELTSVFGTRYYFGQRGGGRGLDLGSLGLFDFVDGAHDNHNDAILLLLLLLLTFFTLLPGEEAHSFAFLHFRHSLLTLVTSDCARQPCWSPWSRLSTLPPSIARHFEYSTLTLFDPSILSLQGSQRACH